MNSNQSAGTADSDISQKRSKKSFLDRFRSKSKMTDQSVKGSSQSNKKPLKTINSKTTADNSRFSSYDHIDLSNNLENIKKDKMYMQEGVQIEEEKSSGGSDSIEIRKKTENSRENERLSKENADMR